MRSRTDTSLRASTQRRLSSVIAGVQARQLATSRRSVTVAPFDAWRTQLRAELTHGGGAERLSEAERLCIGEGRSFEGIFNGGADVQPLAWRLPGAKCEIAYADDDPNPWCMCMTTIPASAEAVLEAIWQMEDEPMKYSERVSFRVLDRPSPHSVRILFRVYAVPLMPPLELPLCGTWVKGTDANGQEEYVIAILGVPSQGSDPNFTTSQLISLRRGLDGNTTVVKYIFQTNVRHITSFERLLPGVRLRLVLRHRHIMASFRRYFEKEAAMAETLQGGSGPDLPPNPTALSVMQCASSVTSDAIVPVPRADREAKALYHAPEISSG